MKDIIKVSVICVTYNQEKYIEQALRGFVSQKTNFKFEVIVADDCSTDQTPTLVAQFAKDHPDVVRPILRKKNLGVIANNIDSLRQAQGEYIALCEGDDYWTDPQKLQKQVDFLDAHKDYAVCFHPVRVVYENSTKKDEIYPAEKADFTLEKLVEHNFIQTNSVMYRATTYNDLPNDVLPLDWYLHLLHAKKGKIGFIDRTMSVYRIHTGGIWWSDQSSEAEYKFLRANFIPHLQFYARASALLDNEAYSIQMQHQALALLERVLRLDIDKLQSLLIHTIKEAPETLQFALGGVSGLISDLYKRNYDLSQELLYQKKTIEGLEDTIKSITSSRSYKIGKKITRPMRTVKNVLRK